MRKLMIAMLALAVVFGFAACDNNSGSTSLMDQYVVALEITDGPTQYFEGDDVNVEDYTVTATRNDGSTFVVPAKDLVYAGSTLTQTGDSKDAKEETIGTITYNGIYVGTINKPTVEVKATVYNIDAVGVTGPETARQYYNTQGLADVVDTDYVVTVYALAETTDKADAALYSKVLSDDEYTITANPNVSGSPAVFATGTVTLTFAPVANSSAPVISGGKNTADIAVKADVLTSISIAIKDGKEAVVGATKGTASDYVDVTYTMESGKTYKNSEYQGTAATVAWASSANATFVANTAESITATVTGSGISAANVSITPVADYIKSFTVSGGGLESGNATVKLGTELDATKMTVTVTWASGTTHETPDAEALTAALRMTDGVNSNLTKFATSSYKVNDKLPISFYLTGLDVVNEKTDCTQVISVVAAV